MHKIFYLTLLVLFSADLRAQNLVPNGNFEQDTACPPHFSCITYCSGWSQYTGGGSSDYFNTCAPNIYQNSIPKNYFGYQIPASGNAYAGLYTYAIQATSNYKEYITRGITPLIPSVKYEVSMSVSLANNSTYASDDLGIYFFKNSAVYGSSYSTTVPATPQVWCGTIYDTSNWIRISSIYIPDSTYDHIVIGGFKDYNAMHLTSVNPVVNGAYSYYYIDSVVIRAINDIYAAFDTYTLCTGDSIILPFYTSNVTFRTGNIFKLQLSDSSGNFLSPTEIGTLNDSLAGTIKTIIPNSVIPGDHYKLRVVSTYPSDSGLITFKNIKISKFSFSNLSISPVAALCLGDTLKLKATSANVKYFWTGPNGFMSTDQNTGIINIQSSDSGNYILRFLDTSTGCSIRDTISVTVKSLPASPFTSSSNTLICSADTLKLFSSNTLSGSSYAWSGPNSFTSASQNPFITHPPLTDSGWYHVTATFNGCYVKDSVRVVVNPSPQVSLASNSPVCAPDSLQLFATSTLPGSFGWSGPNSFTSTLQNPVIINTALLNSGRYYLLATSVPGCTVADSIDVTVYPIVPVPSVSSNSPVCTDGYLTLTANSTNVISSWNWSGPGGYTSLQQSAVRSNIKTSDAGIYSLTATDANGCNSLPATAVVSVIQGPSVSAYASPSDTVCTGQPVTMVALPFNAGTPSYLWYRNSMNTGITTANMNTGNLNSNDTFYVQMTASGGMCNTPIASNPVVIHVLPLTPPPIVTITDTPSTNIWSGLDVKFSISSLINGGTKPAYQWKRNGKDIGGAVGDHWEAATLDNNDTVCLLVTSSERCATPKSAMSNCIVLEISTGIDDVKNNSGISIYPNPNNGSFTVETKEPGNFYLYNITGQLVAVYKLTAGKNYIDISDKLSAGTYTGKLVNLNNTVINFKITLQ